MITVNVKVLSDRSLDIKKKVFGGMQGDIDSVEIVWDVSDVYKGNTYFVEIFGAAGTFSKTLPLEVVYDETNTTRTITFSIPPELTEIGGQAVVYLVEEQIENEAVKRRVCTYPLRVYLPHRSASSNEVKVEEYNRQLTDMYLAVVCAREAMETLNKDSATNLADAKAKLDKAILDYNRAIEVATGGINFGSGMKDFNIGDTYFGVEILKNNTYVVFVDGEYFAFDDSGAIKLSDEYLSGLSQRFDEKQVAFDLFDDEALEWAEDENGKRVLRIKSSSEVYQDEDGLHLNLGSGLKKTDNGAIGADYTEHNVDKQSHNDIRLLVSDLTARINAVLNSDDVNLDQLKEIVAYIKENRSVIESVTTSKVNVSDIIDNLTTNVSNKPLSAKQGVELKKLIDAIVIPTKISEFDNDAGFVDDAYVGGAVESVNLPRDVRVASYDSSSVTVRFETGNGGSMELSFNIDLTVSGKHDVYVYKIADGGGYVYTIALEEDAPENSAGRVYAFTYKVTNGEMHYLAVGSAVLLNRVVLLNSVTCDGAEGTYIFPNLNLDYFLLDISSLAGAPSNQAYRVYINGDPEKIVGYFNGLVHTTNKQEAFVRVDLKNIQSIKGSATDRAGIPAQETKVGYDVLPNISAITSVTIAPYNKDVLFQSGSTITLKGREIQ